MTVADGGLVLLPCFSALQRAENSSIRTARRRQARCFQVSVLFSEPKIPQCRSGSTTLPRFRRFSALQRAENSSIFRPHSADAYVAGFSALQRAENSSIRRRQRRAVSALLFQCSSASRKFLNRTASAGCDDGTRQVSVLFSEPKIPQCSRSESAATYSETVSVLFSEPKIPQSYISRPSRINHPPFQCSSASRKFLNAADGRIITHRVRVSVLFSEPKIPQFLLTS